MTEVKGVWEFVGKRPMTNINPLFVAYEFPAEELSQKAWEEAQHRTHHISCWRLRDPDDEGIFRCIALGENELQVRLAEQIFVRFGGVFWKPDQEVVRSLTLRRYKQALDAARTGDTSKHTNHWREDPQRLRTDGSMESYDKP